MPEGSGIALRLREEGMMKLASFLTSVCSARHLSFEEVQAYKGRSLTAGWEFHVQTDLKARRLQVLLDLRFPFSLPHFFLVDRPEFLTWPHVEEDGRLCLQAENKVAKPDHPTEIVGVLLGQALDLICGCERGTNEGDFRTEFYSYWTCNLDEAADGVYSLLKAEGPSRLVRIWRGESWSVLGESEEEVLSWQRNRDGKLPQVESTGCACLLWLPQALLPKQYPRTAGDIYRLAQTAPGGKALLERFSRKGQSPFYFILGAESGNGPCFAAVKTRTPVTVDIRGGRRNRSLNGFRPGKIPQSVVVSRSFSDASPASRLRVDRVDSAWIHGRGYDPHHATLLGKRVLIVGCGSVGAPIAQQLVMSGVGHLGVVDPETLTWANVGRHPLGAEYVGQNKAEALADKLQRSYPHATIQAFGVSYEEFVLQEPALVRDADLIVCATAEWDTEMLLNSQRIQREITRSTLYTWTEPYACAGHAVLLSSTSPCLQCGMTLQGEARTKITEWQRGITQELHEPACGAVFQPYGPVELQGTISLASSLALDSLLQKQQGAIHRVWAGPHSLLVDAGGTWAEAWLAGHPERQRGGLQEELEWTKDELCPVCGGNDIGVVSTLESEILNSASSLPQQSSTI
jgi:hypothetical protein